MGSLLEVTENTFDEPVTAKWLESLGRKTVDPGAYLPSNTMVHVEIKQHVFSRMIRPIRVDSNSAWIIWLTDVSFNRCIKTKMEYFDFIKQSEDFVNGLHYMKGTSLETYINFKNSIYNENGFGGI